MKAEKAQGLDLVAEELESNGLAAGRGEDVDDAATDGELASLLRLFHAGIAGESQLLGEPLGARLVANAQANRRRLRPGRGNPPLHSTAEAQTRPPARGLSARARSPIRAGGGSSPLSQRTPREASRPTFSSPRNQPAASAASRASASSGRTQTSGPPRSSQRAARKIGSSGSETRAAGRLDEGTQALALCEPLREDVKCQLVQRRTTEPRVPRPSW